MKAKALKKPTKRIPASDDGYVSVVIAASILHCSRWDVMRKLARKEIQGEQVAGRMVILRSSLPNGGQA